VCGRNRADLDVLAAEISGEAMAVDLLDREATDRFLAQVGSVDILVNNAGAAESASLEKTTDEMWDRIMELDATSPFRVTRALVPAMINAGWGRVVNIASNAGISGYGYTVAYCAAKHAMVGFTRALAIDLARTAVTINAICPGWVETALADEAVARIAEKTGRSLGDAKKTLEGMSPQRRMIKPEEVADLAVILNNQDLVALYKLSQDFIDMVSQQRPEVFDEWLAQAEESIFPAFRRFAHGLRHDYTEVKAALSLPWSNGQVEGQVNRLKLIKRQMYGRAKFDLLRQRVLQPI